MVWAPDQEAFVDLSKSAARQILHRIDQSKPDNTNQYRAEVTAYQFYADPEMTKVIDPNRLEVGTTVWVSVELRNVGQKTWWNQDTHLKLSRFRDTSKLNHKDWLGKKRPAHFKPAYVLEGESGRFEFPITVPNRAGRVFEEFFDLVNVGNSNRLTNLARIRLIIGTQTYSEASAGGHKLLLLPFLVKEKLGNRFMIARRGCAHSDGRIKSLRCLASKMIAVVISKAHVSFAKKLIGQLVRRLMRLKTSVTGASGATKVTINQDDIIFIPSGFWSNQAYINNLSVLASRYTVVHTVHDIFPFICPDLVKDNILYAFRGYAKKLLPVMSHIVSISNNTSKDVNQLFRSWGLPRPKLLDIRLGSDLPQVKPQQPIGVYRSEPNEFILAVSTVEPRKNYELLLQVYALAKERKQTLPHLYIAGRIDQEWQINHLLIRRILNDPYLATQVTLLGQITDEELVWLYQNAQLTVFPSVYEGWGLPVTESLAYGKITLCAATSAVVEAGGKLADYFSPYSAASLLELLLHYKDSHNRQAKQTKIRSDYQPLVWAQTIDTFHNKLMNLKDS